MKALTPTWFANYIVPYKSASKQHFSLLMKCVFKLIKDSETSDFKVKLLDKLISFNPGLDLDQWIGEYTGAGKLVEEAYKDYVKFIHSYSKGNTPNSSKIRVNLKQLSDIVNHEKTSYETLELMVYIARSNSKVYEWFSTDRKNDHQQLLLQTIENRIKTDTQRGVLEKERLLRILHPSQ